MRRALALLALLAACTTPPGGAWRDTTQPIASAALFEPARFAGQWHVVARFPRPADQRCSGERLDYDGEMLRFHCLSADGRLLREWDGPAVAQAYPGRFTTAFGDDFGLRDLWVLWVDFDYRTAVIGTPSGEAGYVLSRGPAIPPDRMEAAREMLDFNGYDLAGLETVSG